MGEGASFSFLLTSTFPRAGDKASSNVDVSGLYHSSARITCEQPNQGSGPQEQCHWQLDHHDKDQRRLALRLLSASKCAPEGPSPYSPFLNSLGICWSYIINAISSSSYASLLVPSPQRSAVQHGRPTRRV